MIITEIIAKKRDGFELTDDEIGFFVNAVVDGSIADYQISAMLMAMYIRGLSERETLSLTSAMANSGDTVDLSELKGIKADKHSTGGVGDKTTLIVAPVVASCGVIMAKMSGRGLGHTGGTVDKLEAIPGIHTEISAARFIEIVREHGLCVVGQSGNLCPADKKLYALRDVTATVDNIELIAASIMSKKLAAGADIIVLDVKCGSGAFMKNKSDAALLANKMVDIGKGAGKSIAALITDMDIPLGHNIGNSLEVIEAVQTLKGNGPADLTELCVSLAAKILQLSGKGGFEECKALAMRKIESGEALEKLKQMVQALGGESDYIDNTALFKPAEFTVDFTAPREGYITHIDTAAVGEACVILGAGRAKKEDKINPAAGIVLHKKTCDFIRCGDTVATLMCGDKNLLPEAIAKIKSAFHFGEAAPERTSIILDIIE